MGQQKRMERLEEDYPGMNGRKMPLNDAVGLSRQFGNTFLSKSKNFSSSQTIFHPERYLKARGLNISIDKAHGHSDNLVYGRVMAQPTIFGNAALVGSELVGKSFVIKTQNLPDEYIAHGLP